MCLPNRLVRLFLLSTVVYALLAIPALADSQARIVRLSDVKGDVLIDRNAGQGMEKAFLNLPIMQGTKIQTKSDGRAEIEFENGSTLRIVPETVVEFPQLSLRDPGTRVSLIRLEKGTAYINFDGSKDDDLSLGFGKETLTLKHAAHLRIVVGESNATVAVFAGEAEASGPSGPVEIAKNKTATFDFKHNDRSTLARSVEPDPYDAWDKEQGQNHDRYLISNSGINSGSPYAYGNSDLNYYGSYFNVPGYGTLWQPYMVGMGWDPFMNGAWVFYPGYGYGWVSAYPWGWTPYYYGSWAYVPAYGWAWQPGGTWAGWSGPRVSNPPATFRLPEPPTNGGGKTIVVARGPMPSPLNRSGSKLQIPENSAGIGIPRWTIRNLGELSQTVQKSGFATTTLHSESFGSPGGWWGGGSTAGPRVTPGYGIPASPHPAGVTATSHSSSGGAHPK